MSYSQTKDQSSNNWLQINLGSVHCVEKVIVFHVTGSVASSWICKPAPDHCTCSEGTDCDDYNLGVSTETDKDVATYMCPTVPNCRYMDTVKYERTDGGQMVVFEIAIIGTSGQEFVFKLHDCIMQMPILTIFGTDLKLCLSLCVKYCE